MLIMKAICIYGPGGRLGPAVLSISEGFHGVYFCWYTGLCEREPSEPHRASQAHEDGIVGVHSVVQECVHVGIKALHAQPDNLWYG